MKLLILTFLLAAIVIAECGHTFMGTNFLRSLVFHKDVNYSSYMMKRIENFNYTLPYNVGRTIQGILAYDLTHTGASANVTQGGIGYNFVNLRLMSDRSKGIHYDIYIYS